MKLLIALLLLAACLTVPARAEYVIIPVEAPLAAAYKSVPTHNVQVGKVVAVEAYGVVTNKTILLQRIMSDGSTNVVSTLTTTVTTGQKQTFDLSSAGYFWLQKGEVWRRAGTETNAPIRLIVEQ